MQVFDLSNKTIIDVPPLVATLGFFDGVHIGHQHLISHVKKKAKTLGYYSAVITFPIHPRKVLQSDYQPKLLCGFEEKLELLAKTGVDYCYSLPFTRDLSKLTAQEFISTVLKDKIGVQSLIVGYDHRFGHNREEGFDDYCRYAKEVNMEIEQGSEMRIDDEGVSSSRVRRLLLAGNIKKANHLLSYNYQISGRIVEGYKIGRTIGFPTANIEVWEKFKVVPQFGVYAVLVHIDNEIHEGMLYIGTRPTIQNGSKISLEVNIFDFEEDLYNKSLTVEFIDFIRADEKFDNIKLLTSQISKDKETVKTVLENYNKLF